MIRACLGLIVFLGGVVDVQAEKKVASSKTPKVASPKTPKGLPQCESSLAPERDLRRKPGESIRYVLILDGMAVGTLDFSIARKGKHKGAPVTEYRSKFALYSLLQVFMPAQGKSTTLVGQGEFWPKEAALNYETKKQIYNDRLTVSEGGKKISLKYERQFKLKPDKRPLKRSFSREAPVPVLDFVSAFYFVRSLSKTAEGCFVFYGNRRLYTLWWKKDGTHQVATPVGRLTADRYVVRFGYERAKKIHEGKIWLGTDKARLPYKAEIYGKKLLVAKILFYEES